MKAAFSAMESTNFVLNKKDGLSWGFLFSSTRKANKNTCDSSCSRFLFLFGYLPGLTASMCLTRLYQNLGGKPSRSRNYALSCATRGNRAKLSSQITALVSFIRRKSTTWPICKLWHRFSTSRHTIQSRIELILSLIFDVALFRFLISHIVLPSAVMHNVTQTSEEWKLGKWNPNAKIPEIFAIIPSCGSVFPYGLSLVHMLSLLTTARLTKELLEQTLIKICQLHQEQ